MCPFAVRVAWCLSLADFLGSLFTLTIDPSEDFTYCQVRLLRWICLPQSASTLFNGLFRQTAEVSLLRLHIAICASNGILTVSAIGFAFRLILRSRLTPGRLTLPGKPWSCGEGASHTLYRYLYLHLLFRTLQRGSSPRIPRIRNAPLPMISHPAASAPGFIPDYYPCTVPRLVSCYALFE